MTSEGERACDADALPLAAGELVRVAVVVLGVEADQLEQVLHRPLRAVFGLDLLQTERRTHDRSDGVPRVQRGVRVLEDHLHLAAQRTHAGCRQVGDVPAVEVDPTAGRLLEPGEHAPGGRLPAAGLADEAERLAARDGEVDAVDRLDCADLATPHPARDREVLGQPGDFEQRRPRRAGVGGPRGDVGDGHGVPALG
jgi:hypothetical protein